MRNEPKRVISQRYVSLTDLDAVENTTGLDFQPQLKTINESASYIFAGHFIDVSKSLQKRRVGLVRQQRLLIIRHNQKYVWRVRGLERAHPTSSWSRNEEQDKKLSM
jgi:hypothetical protein